MKFKAVVITVSDKGSRGERTDTSGPAVAAMLKDIFDVGEVVIVPDEMELIANAMKEAIDKSGADLVVSTGGTGVSKRDVTPEATMSVIDKELPGFAEIMRAESYKITRHALISRAVCGIRGESMIINLPGSEKARGRVSGFRDQGDTPRSVKNKR